MTLNIEVDDYIPDLSESSGVRLLIHDPYNMAFVDTDGFSLAPGKDHIIGVKKVSVTTYLYLNVTFLSSAVKC